MWAARGREPGARARARPPHGLAAHRMLPLALRTTCARPAHDQPATTRVALLRPFAQEAPAIACHCWWRLSLAAHVGLGEHAASAAAWAGAR